MLTNSNLLVKNNAAEVDTSVPKVLAIAILGVASATALGYFTNAILKESSANNFILAGVSAILFIILFFLQSIFIKGIKLNLLIALFETIGLALFFVLTNYSLVTFTVIVLIFLSLYSCLRKSKKELNNQIKVSVMKIARVSVPKIVISIAILISAIYTQPFYPKNMAISKNLISNIIYPSETLIRLANNYLHLGLGDFSINMTISEIAQKNNLPEAVLEQQVKNWGVKISKNETILDAIYNFVNGKIQSFKQTVKWSIFGALFLLAILTVKGLFWLFYWLIYLFIYLFYEILMALGFSRLSYEQVSKEIIIL